MTKTAIELIQNSRLQSWLEDPGSFIERLKRNQLCPQIIVLRQGWHYPSPAERLCLKVRLRCYAFIREVEIRYENQPIMFARTTIPASTLTGQERRLTQLGASSLGSVLFSYPGVMRSAFEIKTCRLLRYSASELWERQSFFYLKRKPLLLTEVFLPPFLRIIKSL